MDTQGTTRAKPLYTLIPLNDFRAILSIDERDDVLSEYCLITATYSIEQYCRRRLIQRTYFDHIPYSGDLTVSLREYPVTEILSIHAIPDYGEAAQLIEPEFYEAIPELGIDNDIPFTIVLSPALKRYRKLAALEIVYKAGYERVSVPPDVGAACLELASWNMNRYRGRRIGMIGVVKGGGMDGEHFEPSMPENVRTLLEPYKRKLI